MAISENLTGLQEFGLGKELTLGGRKFIVVKLGDPFKMIPHVLVGGREAEYYLHAYLAANGKPQGERFYITRIIGDGSALRGKSGKRIEAYIFGDLASEA